MTDDNLTPLEMRYVAETLKRLRRLDNTDRGLFAEVLVAESLPGATVTQSWESWDVEWNDARIQVKCSGERQSWHKPDTQPTPAKWQAPQRLHWDAETDTYSSAPGRFADVYVLARHTGQDHLAGWTFYVLSTVALEPIATLGGALSLTRLKDAGIEPVDTVGLPDAVTRAYKEERAQRGQRFRLDPKPTRCTQPLASRCRY